MHGKYQSTPRLSCRGQQNHEDTPPIRDDDPKRPDSSSHKMSALTSSIPVYLPALRPDLLTQDQSYPCLSLLNLSSHQYSSLTQRTSPNDLILLGEKAPSTQSKPCTGSGYGFILQRQETLQCHGTKKPTKSLFGYPCSTSCQVGRLLGRAASSHNTPTVWASLWQKMEAAERYMGEMEAE